MMLAQLPAGLPRIQSRAELLQLIQHLLAHALADHLPTQETDPFPQPA